MRTTPGLLVALAVSSASAAAQLPYVEVEFDPGLQFPGALVSQVHGVSAGSDGGWVATSSYSPPSGGRAPAIYGSLPGSPPGPPQLLRVEQDLQGISQSGFTGARLAAGRVAYLTNISVQTLSPSAAWIDDDLIAQRGDAIGASGLTWDRLVELELATDGSLTVAGWATTAAGPASEVVVHYPSEQVLLQEGAFLPAFGENIAGIRSFDSSPDGGHWCAVVDLDPSIRSAIIVDGQVYGIAPSSPLVTGRLVSIFGSQVGLQRLDFIHGVRVTDGGEVIIDIEYGGRRIIARELVFAQELDRIEGSLLAVDALGRALVKVPSQGGLGVSLGGERLDTDQTRGVDLDGDGLVDPNLVLSNFSSTIGLPSLSMTPSGEVFGMTRMTPDGGAPRRIVLRASLATRQEIVCEGEPNQSGNVTHLRATGQDHVRYGRLRLHVIDLRTSGFALPLFSKSMGNTPMLGGGQGTLCLGGAVGRSPALLTQPTGAPYQAYVDVYLGAIPQPTGSVSAVAGETWYMQAWFRDTDATGFTNLSDAIAVTLR